jgi:hypothetical protein
MKFRQFLAEYSFNTSDFGADARHGYWGLPSLNTSGILAQRMPPGFFKNLSQMAGHYQNLSKFGDEDYIWQQALEKLSALAENAASGIINKKQALATDPAHKLNSYLYADFSPDGQSIVGLQERDIISGLYPRLRHEEMRRAQELGIITSNTSMCPDCYDLHVPVLKEQLLQMREKLADKEHGHASLQHLAGMGDQALQAAQQRTRQRVNHSGDPWAN